MARCRDFREIDRDAAELDAGREALQQAADHHEERRDEADQLVARHAGDRERPDRHQPEG
jgi:hypothetical protein